MKVKLSLESKEAIHKQNDLSEKLNANLQYDSKLRTWNLTE